MFKFFNKDNEGHSHINFADLDGVPLKEGDIVVSLRYDLGRCKVIRTPQGYEYESEESGKKVHWLKMVDAATKNQKVRKI